MIQKNNGWIRSPDDDDEKSDVEELFITHKTNEEETLLWCRRMLDSIRTGGVWAIPRSQLMFKVDHDKKQLVLVDGDVNHPDFLATKIVFAKIGWAVINKLVSK